MYKVLLDGRWSPIVTRKLQGWDFIIEPIKYPVGEWVSGEFGIFLCDTLESAKETAKIFSGYVWQCEARNVRHVAYRALGELAVWIKSQIREYMTQRGSMAVADAIFLKERVDV